MAQMQQRLSASEAKAAAAAAMPLSSSTSSAKELSDLAVKARMWETLYTAENNKLRVSEQRVKQLELDQQQQASGTPASGVNKRAMGTLYDDVKGRDGATGIAGSDSDFSWEGKQPQPQQQQQRQHESAAAVKATGALNELSAVQQTATPTSMSPADGVLTLQFYARDLFSADPFLDCDASVHVFVRMQSTKQWVMIAKTEVRKQDVHPVFATKLNLRFDLASGHPELRFDVMDVDHAAKEHLIGSAFSDIDELVARTATSGIGSDSAVALPLSSDDHYMNNKLKQCKSRVLLQLQRTT
jgi:hypothetical protein